MCIGSKIFHCSGFNVLIFINVYTNSRLLLWQGNLIQQSFEILSMGFQHSQVNTFLKLLLLIFIKLHVLTFSSFLAACK
jgi:hypothetical protein